MLKTNYRPGAYLLIAEQADAGCDYTIGCGIDIVNLGQCQYMSEAIAMATHAIAESFTGERQIKTATIVRVAELQSVNVGEVYETIKAEQDRVKASESVRREQDLLAALLAKHGNRITATVDAEGLKRGQAALAEMAKTKPVK